MNGNTNFYTSEREQFEQKYHNYYDASNVFDSMFNLLFVLSGNEEIFWLSIAMLHNAEYNENISSAEVNKLYAEAVRQLQGLQFVGYLDRAHNCIISQYGININQ